MACMAPSSSKVLGFYEGQTPLHCADQPPTGSRPAGLDPSRDTLAPAVPAWGQFEPFDRTAGDWDSYFTRFRYFLADNDVTDPAPKKAKFLSVCGDATFATLRSLLSPVHVDAADFDTIAGLPERHFAPKRSLMASRHAFYARSQALGESVREFVLALRKAARHCKFRDLEDMLLDRLVGGLRDEHLQRRLLAKEPLTFQEAFKEALATEEVEKLTRQVRQSRSLPHSSRFAHHEELKDDPGSTDDRVHRTQGVNDRAHHPQGPPRPPPQRSVAPPRVACAGCGDDHDRRACRFCSATCRSCGRVGHIARVCRSRPRHEGARGPRGGGAPCYHN